MLPATFRIRWRDNSVATVNIQPAEREKPRISISGPGREHLLGIFDYQTTGAIAAEIAYIAQRHHATVEQVS